MAAAASREVGTCANRDSPLVWGAHKKMQSTMLRRRADFKNFAVRVSGLAELACGRALFRSARNLESEPFVMQLRRRLNNDAIYHELLPTVGWMRKDRLPRSQ